MSGLLILVGFAAFMMILAVALTPFWIWVARLQTGKSAFEQLADHYSGSFHPRGIHQFPEVTIDVNGVPFLIETVASKRNVIEQVICISSPWPDTRFRLRLTPETFGSRFKQLLGMQDVHIGRPQFDEAFVVQTNRRESLPQFLTEDAQTALLSLLNTGAKHEFDLNIVGGNLDWRKKTGVGNAEQLIGLVDSFLRAYFAMLANIRILNKQEDAANLGPHEITWLPGKPRGATFVYTETRTPVCLVCGSEVLDQRVQCRSCRTAHHRECWEYFGKCATYGCGQKRYRKVR